MQQSKARIVADGVMAGLIGGGVIAAWFFVFDAARGQPLDTPALLATALLHGARQSASTMPAAAWLLVGEYAIAHFAAFALIGAIGALLIDASERHAELFGISADFHRGVRSVFYLGGDAAGSSGAGRHAVVEGHHRQPDGDQCDAGVLPLAAARAAENLLGPWMGVAREGIISGILGAVIVAVWFLGDGCPRWAAVPYAGAPWRDHLQRT